MFPDFPWKKYLIVVILIGLFVFGLGVFQFFQQERLARVVFLNVGEGNAVLIQNHGQNILIDGGPDKTILEKLDQFIPFYRRKLDLVISLSPRKESLAGLISVVKDYRVDRILDNCANGNSGVEVYWRQEIKNKNTVCWQNNQVIDLNNENYLKFFLLPKQNKQLEGAIWLRLNSKTFLFSPGVRQNGEKWLADHLSQSVDIWQIPRQGTKGAIWLAFLRKIKPKIAVIQSGQNRFKKINWQTIKILEDYKIKIKRTDSDGDIIFDL